MYTALFVQSDFKCVKFRKSALDRYLEKKKSILLLHYFLQLLSSIQIEHCVLLHIYSVTFVIKNISPYSVSKKVCSGIHTTLTLAVDLRLKSFSSITHILTTKVSRFHFRKKNEIQKIHTSLFEVKYYVFTFLLRLLKSHGNILNKQCFVCQL